jgi:hypothetical protein
VAKLDLYVKHKADYAAPRSPVIITIEPAKYLAIEGSGATSAPPFQAAIGALYNVAFTVKMARKFAGRDYAVSKLEGVWWGRDGALDITDPDTWRWQLMIRTPPFITAGEVRGAIKGLVAKGKPAEVTRVTLVTLREGRVVQMLHVGPYDKEAPTIAAMKAFAESKGRRFHGRHHEIYLSDPRRVAPAKLRTILRQPVR